MVSSLDKLSINVHALCASFTCLDGRATVSSVSSSSLVFDPIRSVLARAQEQPLTFVWHTPTWNFQPDAVSLSMGPSKHRNSTSLFCSDKCCVTYIASDVANHVCLLICDVLISIYSWGLWQMVVIPGRLATMRSRIQFLC